MLVLALDTTTLEGSVALVSDDRIVEERPGDRSRTHADPSGRPAGCSPVYAGGTTWICGDGRPSSGTSRGGGATATACQPVSPSWAVTRNEKLCGSRSASMRAATSTALGFFGSAPAASG